jgi:hypothetical protein
VHPNSFIHPTAGRRSSANWKAANFAFWAFSEVALTLVTLHTWP